ncbi:MAG: hypothetical protein ABIU05_26160, partial [Nitrospirales bacterium]
HCSSLAFRRILFSTGSCFFPVHARQRVPVEPAGLLHPVGRGSRGKSERISLQRLATDDPLPVTLPVIVWRNLFIAQRRFFIGGWSFNYPYTNGDGLHL